MNDGSRSTLSLSVTIGCGCGRGCCCGWCWKRGRPIHAVIVGHHRLWLRLRLLLRLWLKRRLLAMLLTVVAVVFARRLLLLALVRLALALEVARIVVARHERLRLCR